MTVLAAAFSLAGALWIQEGDPGGRERDLLEAIADLEREVAATGDQGTRERLGAKLRALRRQAERLRDRGKEYPDPEGRERARARIEELNARLRENPEDAAALMERGELRRRLGDVRGADEDRVAAARLDPALKDRMQPRFQGGPHWGPPQPGWERRQRPGPPEEGRPGRGPGPFNPDEVRAWLRDAEPETHRRLVLLEEEGRLQEVMEMLGAAEGRRRETEEMKRHDPAAYERMSAMRRLERESIELAESLRNAPPGPQRDEGVKRLGEILGRLFDLREEARAREVVELKRRIEELEKSLAGRKANKERIVERRRKELLGEKIDEDW